MAILYKKTPACICGCNIFETVKEEIKTEKNGYITQMYLKCVACKQRQLKQKIRVYNSTEELSHVQMDKKELVGIIAAFGNRIHAAFTRRSSDH